LKLKNTNPDYDLVERMLNEIFKQICIRDFIVIKILSS